MLKVKESQSQKTANPRHGAMSHEAIRGETWMASLSDAIEQYLLKLLRASKDGVVELQRSELSEMFGCSPSQINYVLETRFTTIRGFIVESRRGGAGYIRITRIVCPGYNGVLELINGVIGEQVNQEHAEQLLDRLVVEGFLTAREAAIIAAAIDRQTLRIGLPDRDALRARLLKAMLLGLLRTSAVNGSDAGGSAIVRQELRGE